MISTAQEAPPQVSDLLKTQMLGILQESQSELIRVPTINEFIEKCLEFNTAHPELDVTRYELCPVHVYAAQINKPCRDTIAGIQNCKVCGQPTCKICGNHNVTQISRVTGYIQAVSGWGESKKQELKDRQRYNIGVGGTTSNVPKALS
jgi:hypothetical protein